MKQQERYKWLLRGVALVLFIGLVVLMKRLNMPMEGQDPTRVSKQQFASAKVLKVMSDDATPDTWTEGLRVGSQYLEVEILNGIHKGKHLETWNYLSAYYNVDAKVGTKLLVMLDTDEKEEIAIASVFNYDRTRILGGFVLLFMVIIVLIGGKKGLKAILGLIFTLIILWGILMPLILRGFSPILCTIGVITLATIVSLLLLNGFSVKSLCATLGCVGGVAAAGLVAWVVGEIGHLNGFNMEEAESIALLTSGFDVRIKGLLISGILISALGAVMDVAMSITSSIYELASVNPNLGVKALFQSGMNVGKDAMGTMTNTLILAFTGTSLNTLLLFRIYDFPIIEVLNSDYMCLEVLEGISGSIGIILTIPLVALLSAKIISIVAAKAQ